MEATNKDLLARMQELSNSSTQVEVGQSVIHSPEEILYLFIVTYYIFCFNIFTLDWVFALGP